MAGGLKNLDESEIPDVVSIRRVRPGSGLSFAVFN